ncbi:hypothetical protein D3C85_1017420 [compost metagenome]
MKTFMPVSRLSGLMTKLSSAALIAARLSPWKTLLATPMPEVLTFMAAGSMYDGRGVVCSAASVGSGAPSPMPVRISAVDASAFAEKNTISSDAEGIAGLSVSGINNVRTGSGPPAASEPSALLSTIVELKPCTRSSA